MVKISEETKLNGISHLGRQHQTTTISVTIGHDVSFIGVFTIDTHRAAEFTEEAQVCLAKGAGVAKSATRDLLVICISIIAEGATKGNVGARLFDWTATDGSVKVVGAQVDRHRLRFAAVVFVDKTGSQRVGLTT